MVALLVECLLHKKCHLLKVDRIPLMDIFDGNILNKKVWSRSYMSLEHYLYMHKLKNCVYFRDIEERLYDNLKITKSYNM